MPAIYFIESCSGTTSGVVDFDIYTPSSGDVYSIIFTNGVIPDGCYTVVSADTVAVDVVSQLQLFESCDVCVNGVPVNQFYEYINECCDLSGSTGLGTPYPHPSYPNGLGVAIQLNAVTIGGFNGLNN